MTNNSCVLVTGGAGFIGSHTAVALAQAGVPYVLLDDFSNARPEVLERMARITGQRPHCVEANVADVPTVTRVLQQYGVTAVIHFAAFKAVGESVAQPLRYYQNNVAGSLALMQAMRAAGA